MGLCPFHAEKTPSFHVDDARGTFKCFGCSAWGDVFDFVMLRDGVNFPEAVTRLLGSSDTPKTLAQHRREGPGKEAAEDDEKRRIAHAHEAWLKRLPLHDTLAQLYLVRKRGIRGALPDILGFIPDAYCSPLRRTTGALIAPLQDSAGHVTAVQQVFLDPVTRDAWRGDDGRRIKRTMGAMRDGAVRLAMPDTTMGIAGSVEDALAAMSLFSLPVWAVCGESRLARVWLPDEVEHLMIFADADEAGRKFAADAARAHNRSWSKIEIAYPDEGKDWTEITERRKAHG